jgi:tRNA modification GTPase
VDRQGTAEDARERTSDAGQRVGLSGVRSGGRRTPVDQNDFVEPTLAADTIAALATPPGRGAIAVIRTSGTEAASLVARMAPDWGGRERPREAILATLREPEGKKLLDHALVTYFPSPRSYTGEDLVEISTHGGSLGPALVLSALEALGARLARPGEFTHRAYLNGKLDLLQAEGVRDLVDARTEVCHQVALHQMEGGLSARLGQLREDMIGLEAALSHHVDFPDEDEPPVPLEEVVQAAERVRGGLERLLETAPEGELLREGALAVLAGRPNSGKSSLFNALLGSERAIVTGYPGTTRDALEASVSFEGYPFRLVDTAGLRAEPEELERLGIEVARSYLRRASAVLLCVSAEWGWGEEEEGFLSELDPATPVLILLTKADLLGSPHGPVARSSTELAPGRSHDGHPLPKLSVSVVDGRGLGEIRRGMRDLVFSGLAGEGGWTRPLLTRKRQIKGVHMALTELGAFVTALRQGVPADVAGTHLRPAETALEELLGIISPDDVLDRIFAEFCIGK